MNITVVGTGYVGLVSGTCFAEIGNKVTCVDIDKEKVDNMKKGIIPIYEPGLEDIFLKNIKEERLFFTTSLEEGIKNTDVIFLALPTPPGEDGSADLSYVLQVAKDLGNLISEYTVIVNKSTVPVGTAQTVTQELKKHTDIPFDVVSNPEFLREGLAVQDFMNPDRVIVGSDSEKAIALMKDLYVPFEQKGAKILIMDTYSSELTKYAANSFLATKITFMNEVANFCEIVGADVDKVREGMGADERIGHRFLYPGIGYGGSCFPKDVKALVKSGKSKNFDFQILESVESVNQKQKTILVPSVKEHLGGNLKDKKIALWGLSFKPNTDDIREASALDIIEELTSDGALVTAYDPIAIDNVKKLIGDKIEYASDKYEALKDADALIVATEWKEFIEADLAKVGDILKNKSIFDGRNIYKLSELESLGFFYKSIGRKTIK